MVKEYAQGAKNIDKQRAKNITDPLKAIVQAYDDQLQDAKNEINTYKQGIWDIARSLKKDNKTSTTMQYTLEKAHGEVVGLKQSLW